MKYLYIFILVITTSHELHPQQQTDIPWPTLADSPWPMIKHDPQLTGRSPYKGPQTPTVIWTADIAHGIFSGPVIGEDRNIYFGPYYADIHNPPTGISAYFYCYDNKGNFLWEYNLPDKRPPHNSGAIVDSGGCIYFGALDHYFYALNPNGTFKWRYPIGGIIGSIPNIDLNGNLYVTSYDGNIYSISSEGQLNWKVNHQSFASRNAAFAPDGNTIYIPGADSNIYALNLDGSVKWIFNCSRVHKAVLVDSEGNIYFVPEQPPQYFYSLRDDGTVRWMTLIQNLGQLELYSIPTIDYNGNLYVFAADSLPPYNRALISYDYDGNFRWIFRLDDPPDEDVWQPLICDNEGTVYFGSTFGYNYYAVANDGTLKWKLPLEFNLKQVDNTGTIAEDGTLYIGVHATSLQTGLTKTLYAIKDTGSVGVNDLELTIRNYSLEQNYPNPFNPTTIINYSIPEVEFVTLSIFNILGEEVITLVEEIKSPGDYSIPFDASGFPGGVYIYRLQTVSYCSGRKMIVLK